MLIINYEALKKAYIINTVESQTVIISTDYLIKVIFYKYSEKASIINTAES